MSEERKLILQMVADGKITPEEADNLLQALDDTERAAHSAATEQAEQVEREEGAPRRLDMIIEKTVSDSLKALDQTLRRMEIDLDRRLNDPARGQLVSQIQDKVRRSVEQAVEQVKRQEERTARIAARAARHAEHRARQAAERMEQAFREPPDTIRTQIMKFGVAIDKVSVARTRSFTLPAEPNDRVSLENRVGTIRVDFYDGSDIQVDVKSVVWGEDEADANQRADAYQMSLVRRGSDVTLDVIRPAISAVGFMALKETNLDYTVRVPHGTNVLAQSKVGDIVVVAGDKVGQMQLLTKVGDIDVRVGQGAGFTYDLAATLGTIRTQLTGDEVAVNEQQSRGAYRTGRVGDASGRIEIAVKKTGDIRLTH